MLEILNVVLPVFLVVGSGYALIRTGFYRDGVVDAMIGFATRFAVPCFLFLAMYRLDIGAAFSGALLGSFYGAAIVSFVVAMVLARVLWKRRPGESVVVGFGALFSNSVLLGLPIMERAYGPEELQATFAIIALHAPVCYAVGILTMEFSARDGRPLPEALLRAGKQIVRNELMIGLGLGILANLTGLPLPEPAESALDMVARAALPVALFALGGALTRYSLKAEFGEASMAASCSILLHPFVAWLLAAQVFDLPAPMVHACVLTAAMPTGMNGYVFAVMYNRAIGTAASTVIVGTAAGVATISFWLWFLGDAAIG